MAQTKVWQYRKGATGVELNTINVAVEQYFYGKPDETDLDDRITSLEDDFAPLVENLRDRSSTGGQPLTDDRIPHLVAHLTLRTRQIRENQTIPVAGCVAAGGGLIYCSIQTSGRDDPL